MANDVLAAGEGIETVLSLRPALPTLPMARWTFGETSSRPCCSRRTCAGPISLVTPTRRRRSGDSPDAACRNSRQSRRSRCRLGLAPSTKICAPSASTSSEQPCAFSSCQRTSSASCLRAAAVNTISACRRTEPRRPSKGRSDGGRAGPAMAEVAAIFRRRWSLCKSNLEGSAP